MAGYLRLPHYPGPPYPDSLSRLDRIKGEVLRSSLGIVCEGLGENELDHCIILLRARGLLDLQDARCIRSKEITMRKVEEMIDILKQREGMNGEHALDVLIDVLDTTCPMLCYKLQQMRDVAIAGDAKLTYGEVKELSVKNVVWTIKGVEWYRLGIELNISVGRLDIIMFETGYDVEKAKLRVISEWLNNDPDASWKKLATALERIGHGALHSLVSRYRSDQESGVSRTSISNTAVQLEDSSSSQFTNIKHSGELWIKLQGGNIQWSGKDVLHGDKIYREFPQASHEDANIGEQLDKRKQEDQKQVHEHVRRWHSLPDKLHMDHDDVAISPTIKVSITGDKQRYKQKKGSLIKSQEVENEDVLDESDIFVQEMVTLFFDGASMTFTWNDYGFELHCHKILLPLQKKIKIEILACTSGPFVFPEGHELVSGVYRINCDQSMTATIKIQHCIKNHTKRLIFAVSSDKYPPYHFRRLSGGKFGTQFGTVDVEEFSLYSIIYEWMYGYPPEALYTFYMYHSRRPTYCGSTCMWNVYFFAIRKLAVLEEHLDNYITKKQEVLTSIPIAVEFEAGADKLRLEFEQEKPDFLQIRTYGGQALKKKEIDTYKRGRPPMCQLQVINLDLTVSQFSLIFNIEGTNDSHDSVAFHWPICRVQTGGAQSGTMAAQATLDSMPNITQLKCMEVGGKQLRITQDICTKWENIGINLNFDDLGNKVKIVKRDTRGSVEDCLLEVLRMWMNGESRAYQPATWRQFIGLLRDCEFGELARKLEDYFDSI